MIATGPVLKTPSSARFTIDGDETLERHLAFTCALIASGVRGLLPARKIEAILLAGGYGRGEGGVLVSGGGQRPYNDIEFYVALRGSRHLNEARYGRRLEVLAEILSHLAGIEVEFKVTSLAELERRPVSMFTYDLASGNRLLWADDPAAFPGLWKHHLQAEAIPATEATRLLMNRCTGLLLARARLGAAPLSATDADFVRRNIAKAQLACGDALLTARGLYHWSCRERHARLADIALKDSSPLFDTALRHHAEGVHFKLHPNALGVQAESLPRDYSEVHALARACWLHLESRRLQREFRSIRAYVDDPVDKCAGSPALLNAMLNLRAGGSRSIFRHPRGRAYHALAILLWESESLDDPLLWGRLAAELNARRDTFAGWLDAYQALWVQVR